jgi:probable HAF family extracellular repeat protein
MNIINKHLAYLLIGSSALLGCAHVAMAQQLELGSSEPLEEVGWGSQAYGISADGKVIVGQVTGSNTVQVPFRWDSTTGAKTTLMPYGTGNLANAQATAASADGNTIIGNSLIGTTKHAVAWLDGSTNPTDLPGVGTTAGVSAAAVSFDGSTIVGYFYDLGNIAHAVAWSVANGSAQATELFGLNAGNSAPTALSRDGTVVVGYSFTDVSNTKRHAVKWHNQVLTDLGTLGGDNSYANGVSADGLVIVGASELTSGNTSVQHATVWRDGVGGPTDLGVLTGGTVSLAHAVSADGTVIIGSSTNAQGKIQAVAWYDGGSDIADLGTLGGATSDTAAVSEDGSVIVGISQNQDIVIHAVAWVADNRTPIDLGTLGGKNSSAVGVSADGTVIVGNLTGQDGLHHAALWKLVTVTPPDPEPELTPALNPEPNVNPTPTPEPTPTPTPVGIDVTNTVDTVAALAHDTFAVMGSQGAIVGRLMGGSSSGQGFNDFSGAGLGMAKAGESWYGIYSDVGRAGDSKDVLGWMTLGHAFTDNFSAGATIAHTFWQDMPDNYDRTNNNLGGGIYAQWKDTTQSGTWYMRGSAAINRYDVERTRQVLGYTEPGTGDSTINGWGVQLEAGQSFDLGNKSSFGYYGGLSYTDLKMDGYTETNAYFPFTYSDVKSQRTTAYFGLNYGMALTDKVNWSVNAEIEQDLSHKDPSVIASADYIGAYEFGSDTAHTRGSLSTTVSYALSDAVSIGVTPYVNRTLDKDTAFGAIIGLSGKF